MKTIIVKLEEYNVLIRANIEANEKIAELKKIIRGLKNEGSHLR